MKKTIFFVTISFFLLSLPFYASPKIYRYVDEEGITHFVDNYDAIPEKYRVKAVEKVKEEKSIQKFEEEKSEPQKPLEKSDDKTGASKEQEKIKTESEIIEEWNKKAYEFKGKLEEAKRRLDEAERFKNRTTSSYSRQQYTNADRKAAQETYDEAKKAVEDSQKEWDEFGEKARREAPYLWWRENFYK